MRRAFLEKVRFDRPAGEASTRGSRSGRWRSTAADRLALRVMRRCPTGS